MFGSNSFGALAMDSGPAPSAPAPTPGVQLREGEDVDVEWLKLVKTNHEVYVRVSDKVDITALPNECALLAIANSLDLVIVGSNSDVRIHKLSDIHHILESTTAKDSCPTSTPVQTISLPARPVWIRLAANGERLVVATAGAGVLLFKIADVLSGNTSPYGSVTSGVPDTLIDVLPNPSVPSPTDQLWRYVILLAREGLVILDIEDVRLSDPLAGPFTASCWSVRGKQFVVGNPDGKLVQYTPEGVSKAEIPSPPSTENYTPVFVHWLENDLFLAGYAGKDADLSEPLELFVIHRTKASFTFTKFYDINDCMGYSGRSAAVRHFASLKDWGPQTKHLAFMVSPIASEIGVLHGKPAEGKNVPDWEALILDETARAILPAAKAGVRDDDSSPLGLALDLTSTKPIVRGIVGGEELPDLPPAPRVVAYSHEGFLISFDVRNPEAGAYSGMVNSGAQQSSSGVIAAVPTPAPASATPAAAPPVPASQSAFGSSAFGQSAFGSPSKTPAFGASAFGSSTTTSAFGSSATAKPAFGASAFGSTTPASSPSAFGTGATSNASSPSPSKPSAFGATSAFGSSSSNGPASGSAFGQSAFGTPTKSAFGQSAFGSTTPATKPPNNASAFGGSTPTGSPAPAFGQSSTPTGSAFGKSSFGATPSSGSAFGQSAFGTGTSSGSAFGAFAAKPSGGSTFDNKASPSAFGSSAFGQKSDKPAFTGFGPQPAGEKKDEKKDEPKTAFGASAFGTSAFGSPSALGSGTSAFGGKSSTSAFNSAKPAFTGFGPQPTGEKQSATSPFTGKSAFGPGSVLDKSSSTSSSPFGTSAFGQKTDGQSNESKSSPTKDVKGGLFGSKSNPFATSVSKTDETVQPGTDAFGLGSLTSAMSEKNVPGLADSPPSSPKGKPTVPGLEDSDAEDETTTPSKPPPSSGSAASFIKPATAFASLTSSTGVFGSPVPKPSADKPAAFSAPATGDKKPPAFAASAFGQASKPTATPAFGQATAFGGKPSFGQPSAFGKPATPTATTTPVEGGGFGGFASKASSDQSKSAFGAFANQDAKSAFGGASVNSAPSVFGGDKDNKSLPFSQSIFGQPSSSENEDKGKKEVKPLFSFKIGETKPEVTGYTVDEPKAEVSENSTDKPVVKSPEVVTPPSNDGDDNDVAVAEASSTEGEGQQGEVEDEEEGYETEEDDDYDDGEYGDDFEEYDEEHDDEYDNEYDDHTSHSISQPPEMDTIPEGDENDEQSGSDDGDSKKPQRSPPWYAKDPTGTPSLLSRLGPPVDDGEAPSTPSSSDRPSLLSRMSPPTSTQAQPLSAPSFTLKHAPKTSSPLSTNPSTVPEPGTPSITPPASTSPSSPNADPSTSPKNRTAFDVGLRLASSFKNHDKKDGKAVPPKPADTWTCDTCMLQNAETEKEKCSICEAPRPGATPATKHAGPPAPPSVPTGGFSWGGKPVSIAPSSHNPATSSPSAAPLFAFNKPEAPKPATVSTPAGGEWTCDTCMLKNPDSAKDKCTVCEAARPGAEVAKPAGGFTPPTVPAGGFSFGFGSKPAGPPASKPADPPASKPAGPPAFKPVGPPAPPTGGFNFGGKAASGSITQKVGLTASDKATQWTCELCGLKNEESAKDQCTICEAPRPGAKPAEKPKSAGPPTPPAQGFSFGGFGSNKAKTTDESTKSAIKPTAGFSITPPTSGVTASPFSFKPLTTTTPATPPAPGALFSKTAGTAPSTPAPPPFTLTQAPTQAALALPMSQEQKPKAPLFGASLSSGASVAPPPGPTPGASAPPTTAAPVVEYTIPERPPRPSAAQPPAQTGTSMSAMLERVIADVTVNLTQLESSLDASKKYHTALEGPDFASPTADNITRHTALPFSTLDTVLKITEELGLELDAVRAEVQQSDITLAELQSRMLKTDMKTGQADKFLKARKDPSFARAMQIKELSPQQAADQMRLRKIVQSTEARLSELEVGVSGLKRRSERRNDSRAPAQQPALERMQRTVRNIDVAIRDRQNSMDELTRRINGLRVARGASAAPETRSHTRENTPMRESPKKTHPSSPKAQMKASPHVERMRAESEGAGAQATPPIPSLKPTDEQRARAHQSLASGIRVSHSAAGLTRVPRKNVSTANNLVAHASIARGPVMLDAAPKPGALKESADAIGKLRASVSASSTSAATSSSSAPVASPPPLASTRPTPTSAVPFTTTPAVISSMTSTTMSPSPHSSSSAPAPSRASPAIPAGSDSATPAPAPSGFGFGSIKLNLDPGAITSTPGARRAGGGSSRNHGSAVKLTNTSPRAPVTTGGALFGNVVAPKKDDDDKKPAGFFSFSGFGGTK